jgi:hypothetical protein
MATICSLRKPPVLRHVGHTIYLQRPRLPGFLRALDVLTTIVRTDNFKNATMIQKWYLRPDSSADQLGFPLPANTYCHERFNNELRRITNMAKDLYSDPSIQQPQQLSLTELHCTYGSAHAALYAVKGHMTRAT